MGLSRWKNTGETCTRNDKGKESKANSLGVDNIGGVFVVLLCGLAFAVVIAIMEFCYNSKRNAIAEKVVTSIHQKLQLNKVHYRDLQLHHNNPFAQKWGENCVLPCNVEGRGNDQL